MDWNKLVKLLISKETRTSKIGFVIPFYSLSPDAKLLGPEGSES